MSGPNSTANYSEKQSSIRPLANNYFAVVSPLPARGILLRAYDAVNGTGNIMVAVRPTDPTPLTFYCKVGNAQNDVTPPDNMNTPWADSTQMFRRGPLFQAQNTPVTAVTPVATGASKWVGIGAYRNDKTNAAKEVFPFTAVPPQSTAMVSAKSCLFFTYAADDAVLPYPPEEKFPDCRPYQVAVPMDCARVMISVKPNPNPQTWVDCMGVTVDVDGKDGDADPTERKYYDETFSLRSSGITPINSSYDPVGSWEGLLAGMWDFGRKDDTPNGDPLHTTEIISIGPGLKDGAELSLLIPTNTLYPVKHLQLGSHQEKNWGKNPSGSLSVTLIWS